MSFPQDETDIPLSPQWLVSGSGAGGRKTIGASSLLQPQADASSLRMAPGGMSGAASLTDRSRELARNPGSLSPAKREGWKTESEAQTGLDWRERRDPLAGPWKDDEREGRPAERWKGFTTRLEDPQKDLRRDSLASSRDPFRNGDRPVTEQDIIPGFRREAVPKTNGRWELDRTSELGSRGSWSRGDTSDGRHRWDAAKDSSLGSYGSSQWSREPGNSKPDGMGSVRWHRQDSGSHDRWGPTEPRTASSDRWGKPREEIPARRPSGSWNADPSVDRSKALEDRELGSEPKRSDWSTWRSGGSESAVPTGFSAGRGRGVNIGAPVNAPGIGKLERSNGFFDKYSVGGPARARGGEGTPGFSPNVQRYTRRQLLSIYQKIIANRPIKSDRLIEHIDFTVTEAVTPLAEILMDPEEERLFEEVREGNLSNIRVRHSRRPTARQEVEAPAKPAGKGEGDLPESWLAAKFGSHLSPASLDFLGDRVSDSGLLGALEEDGDVTGELESPAASERMLPVLPASLGDELEGGSLEDMLIHDDIEQDEEEPGRGAELLDSDAAETTLHHAWDREPVKSSSEFRSEGAEVALPTRDGRGWFYRDPQHRQQGPFKAQDIWDWYSHGFFPVSLPVQRAEQIGRSPFVPLGSVLREVQLQAERESRMEQDLSSGPETSQPAASESVGHQSAQSQAVMEDPGKNMHDLLLGHTGNGPQLPFSTESVATMPPMPSLPTGIQTLEQIEAHMRPAASEVASVTDIFGKLLHQQPEGPSNVPSFPTLPAGGMTLEQIEASAGIPPSDGSKDQSEAMPAVLQGLLDSATHSETNSPSGASEVPNQQDGVDLSGFTPVSSSRRDKKGRKASKAMKQPMAAPEPVSIPPSVTTTEQEMKEEIETVPRMTVTLGDHLVGYGESERASSVDRVESPQAVPAWTSKANAPKSLKEIQQEQAQEEQHQRKVSQLQAAAQAASAVSMKRRPAGWATASAVRPSASKSLAEIQREEAAVEQQRGLAQQAPLQRQQPTEMHQEAPPRNPFSSRPVSAAGVWDKGARREANPPRQNSPFATKAEPALSTSEDDALLWDYEDLGAGTELPSQIGSAFPTLAARVPTKNVASGAPSLPRGAAWGASNGRHTTNAKSPFDQWCTDQIFRITGNDNTEMLELCKNLSDSEVKTYLSSFLGDTPDVSEFVAEYLSRRDPTSESAMKVGETVGKDKSLPPQGSRRKGKKGVKKVDPALLGFSVNSSRIMMGEIQRVED